MLLHLFAKRLVGCSFKRTNTHTRTAPRLFGLLPCAIVVEPSRAALTTGRAARTCRLLRLSHSLLPRSIDAYERATPFCIV